MLEPALPPAPPLEPPLPAEPAVPVPPVEVPALLVVPALEPAIPALAPPVGLVPPLPTPPDALPACGIDIVPPVSPASLHAAAPMQRAEAIPTRASAMTLMASLSLAAIVLASARNGVNEETCLVATIGAPPPACPMT
jgi:hypothetical protein